MRKDLGSIKVRWIKFSPEDEIGQLNRWIFNAGETQFRRSFRHFFGEYPALGPASGAAPPEMRAGFSPGPPIINAS
ncbi:hypothetical protein [Agrobacterium vitis]|uniref:hypothetical protein n=1 Tax=Agrobacterium vitis TaxID=373 RepID=UPI0008FB44DB|nr:hypothetical protein [Agrobacterium vitis]OHZ42104.1 hypothetical protein BBL07_07845 [Agrobacterium vitis]